MSGTVGNLYAAVDAVNTTPKAVTLERGFEFHSEAALESAIAAAMARMCAAPDRTLKMQYWREMCRLIDQRTPARRRFMERTQGLA